MPMLTAAILADEGGVNLQGKLDEMVKFVQANPTSIMEINHDQQQSWHAKKYQTELMPEERLMSRVLHSKRLHKKAKVVIFQKLDEMDAMRKRQINRRDASRDMLEMEVDFAQLQDMIFKMIVQEDPEEAKRLGLIAGEAYQDDC